MSVEAAMRYAWLEFRRGFWLMLTDQKNEPNEAARIWTNEKAALSELAADGWTISGPHPRRMSADVDPSLRFRGFCLTRMIQ